MTRLSAGPRPANTYRANGAPIVDLQVIYRGLPHRTAKAIENGAKRARAGRWDNRVIAAPTQAQVNKKTRLVQKVLGNG